MNAKQRDYIAVLCRVHDVDNELGARIRRRVRSGVTTAEANALISLLQELPPKPQGRK